MVAHFLDRVTGAPASQGAQKPADAPSSLQQKVVEAQHKLTLATKPAEHLQHLPEAQKESLISLRVTVNALEFDNEHTGEKQGRIIH